MKITPIVSTDFVTFDADTPVSKVRGAFEDPDLKAIMVVTDGTFEGVVTRRQLASSHHHPDEKVGSLVWNVPKVSPDDAIRDVAQLMIDSESRVLPVFEGGRMRGVVRGDDILKAVLSFLSAATVGEAYSSDLVTVEPDTTFGQALHILREHRITHLPVVRDSQPMGMVSLHDVTDYSSRTVQRSQGGEPPGFDAHGGTGSRGGFRTHGGFGAREGELARMLDLPVRDVMVSPVQSISRDETLETAVELMFESGGSSLVVVTDDGNAIGIITKSDVLKALTWGAEGQRAVQLYGVDLIDDITYDEIITIIDRFDDMHSDMQIIDAKVHLHEHDETLRGSSLLLARIRLFTDRGMFIGTGEGYGARHAINEARDILDRRIRDEKTYGRSKKHPDEDFWEKRFGWLLEA